MYRNNPINFDSNTQPDGGWIRNPYGINISADETTLFATLSEAFKFALDNEPEGTKQTINKWRDVVNSITREKAGENPSSSDLGQGEVFYCKQGYTDTSVGGNDAINPYWQFNRDDDIVPPNLRSSDKYGTSMTTATNTAQGRALDVTTGMGRVYSEMYDDQQQLLWLSAGVPVFTNLGKFFLTAGNSDEANLMNSGSHAGIAGKLLSYARSVTWWAITFPIMAPIYFVRWCNNFNNETITKYYSFKPTQSIYLELVNTMLSYLAVGMGLYPQFNMGKRPDDKKVSVKANNELSDKEIDAMIPIGTPTDKIGEVRENIRSMMKGGMKDSGVPELLQNGPDIFRILNKRNWQFNLLNDSSISTRDITMAAAKLADNSDDEVAKSIFVGGGKGKSRVDLKAIDEQMARMANNEEAYQKLAEERRLMKENKDGYGETRTLLDQTELSIKSAILGIGDYIGFRVEKSTNASESISNSTGSTGLSDKINGYASSQQEARMSSGDSKIIKIAAKLSAGGVTGMVKSAMLEIGANLAGGIASVVQNGNGFLDIPDVWKNSSFSKSHSFNIQLRARYGDPVSIYQSIYIPLTMLLAYAMPRSVGDNMYTSPFVVRAYCKGMFSVPCGMVDSMSITRGASEYGWSEGNLPTAVDITLSIKDLSPTFFLSMQNIGISDVFRHNTNMMEYLDTLSGLGIVEKLYLWPKMMRKMSALFLINRNTTFSPLYWSQRVGRSPMLRAAGSIVPQLNFETTKKK